MTAELIARVIAGLARFVAGATVRYSGYVPGAAQRIYYANHTSHLDFVVLWSALPSAERSVTRPVAGSDYWDRGAVRRFLSSEIFHAVLVDRTGKNRDRNPVDDMVAALDAGDSLIIFPEGTRGDGSVIAPFRSGLFHVASRRRDIELVPVMIENLNRILPKGEIAPIPLLSSITLGAPVRIGEAEEKEQFLVRAREELVRLRHG